MKLFKENIDWLFVGLGNPGEKYAETRHNIGWLVAMNLVSKYSGKFSKGSSIYYYAKIKIDDNTIMTVLPTTYMNASGEAVRKIKDKFALPLERIVIVCDEYNFPLGKVHLKGDGSDGGHNGVASVIEELSASNFLRLRCGIGKNFPSGGMVDYVLSDFLKEEKEEQLKMIAKATESLEYLVKFGIIRAMTDINSGKIWLEE